MTTVQGDLFYCDVAQWPLKDDIGSMEAPLFSLAKKKDLSIREYCYKTKGSETIFFKVLPSVNGAATIFDKDLLLYIGSHIVEARNNNIPVSKTVRIDSSHFLKQTGRGDGGIQYDSIHDMLQRLRGTTIETNYTTGGERQTEGFGMIEGYQIREETSREGNKRRVLSFEVRLSDWFFNGLMHLDNLTHDFS